MTDTDILKSARDKKATYDRLYRAKNREKRAAIRRRWAEENREEISKKKRIYRAENAEQIAATKKAWKLRNTDRVKENQVRHYVLNRDKILAQTKRWCQTHPENLKEIRRRAKERHPGRQKAYLAEWVKKNRGKVRATAREAQRKIRATPKGALDGRMSKAVRRAIGPTAKNGRTWESLVGYSAEELKMRMESLFQNGMNWTRFISGDIEIDHVIPKSKFHYSSTDDIEFKRCWSLDNLQPKWTGDNRAKYNRLEKHEQIPLGI